MTTATTDLLSTFAANLKTRREKSGRSVEELAEACKATPDAWRKWEQGARWPSADSLSRIAAVLSVRPGRLLD